jgi:uncharacterized protein (TIGR03435 family)
MKDIPPGSTRAGTMTMRLNLRILAVKLIVFLLPASVAAQPAPPVRPEFEAATIKPSQDTGKSGVRGTMGRLTLENVPLRVLIGTAYKTRPSLIIGGPSWTDSAKFDVQGKAGDAAGTDAMLSMLQSLLEQRFQLRIRREIREGPLYELKIAKGGPRLKPANCVPFDPNHLPRQAAPGEAQIDYCGRMSRAGDDSRRILEGHGVEMIPTIGLLEPSLTGFLSDLLDRTVIDKTGLSGAFDFRLEWAPERSAATQVDDTAGPSVFTAVQDQLGLKLEAARGPIEFLVIDHAERPSGN